METKTAKMNRYALVTGAGQGIGRAIALELAKNGCIVLINDKEENAGLRETKLIIEADGGNSELIPFDVSQPAAINAVLDTWFTTHPDEYIDVLVNNAGVVNQDLMVAMEPAQWHEVIDVGLNGFFYCTKRVIEGMKMNHHGRVINISSCAGLIGLPKLVHYSAVKAALIGATRSLAVELAPQHITVNAIAPGAIGTKMLDKNMDINNNIDIIPMRRLGKPEEIAYLVCFLCSDKADYISGQTIGINGGLI